MSKNEDVEITLGAATNTPSELAPRVWTAARAAYMHARAPAQLLATLTAAYDARQENRSFARWGWGGLATVTALVVGISLLNRPWQFIGESYPSSSPRMTQHDVPATKVDLPSSVASRTADVPMAAAVERDTMGSVARRISHHGRGRAIARAARTMRQALPEFTMLPAPVPTDTVQSSAVATLPIQAAPTSPWSALPGLPPSMPSLSALHLPSVTSTLPSTLPSKWPSTLPSKWPSTLPSKWPSTWPSNAPVSTKPAPTGDQAFGTAFVRLVLV